MGYTVIKNVSIKMTMHLLSEAFVTKPPMFSSSTHPNVYPREEEGILHSTLIQPHLGLWIAIASRYCSPPPSQGNISITSSY